MLIAVGSENKIKLDAVRRGFEQAGFTDITVVGFNALSDVAEQPFGKDETLAGAKNRATATLTHFKDADIIVGIESGILEDNSDVAIIYCLNKNEDYDVEHIEMSEKVTFPADCVEEARQRGFATVTVGQVMKERGVVNDQTDPHLTLTGKSRTIYLTDTITKLTEKSLETQPSAGCRF